MKPCAFYDWDDAADRGRLTHPTKNCDMQCAVCGFNPAVADRRLEKVRRELLRSRNSNSRSAERL